MSTQNQTGWIATSFAGRVARMASPEVRQLVDLGQRRGWSCTVLGQAPFPREPVRLGDWLIVPACQDSSPVPARALERVQAIFGTGLRPRGFVLVHEAPRLLPAPAQRDPRPLRMSALPQQSKSALKATGIALAVLAALLATTGLAVLALAAIALAALLIVPAILVVGVAVVDPILVAVTEDGYWIEIDRWWN